MSVTMVTIQYLCSLGSFGVTDNLFGMSRSSKLVSKHVFTLFLTQAQTGGDVFWGSNLGNRDGLEAVTVVPAHARTPRW